MTETRAALREKRKERMAQYAQEDESTQVEANADADETTPEPAPKEAVAETVEAEAATETTPEPEATEVDASADSPEGTTPTTEGGQSYEETAPAPETESAGQQLIAEVTAWDNLPADASVDMVLFQYDEENPSWSVFAAGQPLAEVRLSDQPNPADIRALFLSQGYAETVKKACAQDGLQKTLEGISARPYAVAMERSDVVAQLRETMEAEQADSLREKQAEAAQDLMSALGLVLTAMQKGVLVSNPLKTALYEALANVGVAAPVPTVEAVFDETGPAFFETAINQAREWASYSPEAYHQIEASVNKAEKYTPSEVVSAPNSPQLAQQAAFPELPANVPLETKTAGQETMDRKAALRQRLALK